MKRFTFFAAMITALTLVTNASAQTDSKLPTPKEVLKKYADATGGIANYKAIKSISTVAKMSMPKAGMEGKMTMQAVMPDKMSVISELPSIGKIIQASDGKNAWTNSAMGGPRLLKGGEAAQVKAATSFNRLWEPEKIYKSMKTVGVVDVDGKKAYEVALETKAGNKSSEFYDVKTGLLLQAKVVADAGPMGKITVVAVSSDYKKVGKLLFAHKMVQDLPGGMQQIIEFEKYEINKKIDDSVFTPPKEVQELIDAQASKSKGEDK